MHEWISQPSPSATYRKHKPFANLSENLVFFHQWGIHPVKQARLAVGAYSQAITTQQPGLSSLVQDSITAELANNRTHGVYKVNRILEYDWLTGFKGAVDWFYDCWSA